MGKSKIENRLNTMRHKQAQPTDSLILAESAEGKDFSQELSKAQPFDEIPSLTEKQVAFGMCNPQAHLDAKQEKLERFKKKRAEKKNERRKSWHSPSTKVRSRIQRKITMHALLQHRTTLVLKNCWRSG